MEATMIERKIDDSKMKTVVFQTNIDGLCNACVIEELFGDKIESYNFIDGYGHGDVIVLDIIKRFETGDLTSKELMLFNISLSSRTISRLNDLQRTGVNIFYYGYVFKPLNLNGVVTFSTQHTTLTCFKEHYKSCGLEKPLPENLHKFEAWANIGMKYEGGYNDIQYIEEVIGVMRPLITGLKGSLYGNIFKSIVLPVFKSYTLERKDVTHLQMHYYGRLNMAKQLGRLMRLGDDVHNMFTIEGMITHFMRDKVEQKKIKLGGDAQGVAGLLVMDAPAFNRFAKEALSNHNDVNFIMNVSKGFVQVRSRQPFDARTVKRFFVKDTQPLEDGNYVGAVGFKLYLYYDSYTLDNIVNALTGKYAVTVV